MRGGASVGAIFKKMFRLVRQSWFTGLYLMTNVCPNDHQGYGSIGCGYQSINLVDAL